MHRSINKTRFQLFNEIQTITVASAIAWIAMGSSSAHAGLIFGITTNVAHPGSSSNGLDVTLTNTGTTSADDALIAGFSFEINAASSNITFSGVSTSTSSVPYIFAGNSLYGPDISLGIGAGGQSISAGDNYAPAHADITLPHGQTIGLGFVSFELSPTTPLTSIDVSFTAYPKTGVNDSAGFQYTFILPGNAQIDVTSTVPEPSTIVTLGIGVLGLIVAKKYMVRQRVPCLSWAQSID